MRNLLFILPIMALSFNLQAQQPDSVIESDQQFTEFTDVEVQFLDAVRDGETEQLDSFDVDVNSTELGEMALSIAVSYNIEALDILWDMGARMRNEDRSIIEFSEMVEFAERIRIVNEVQHKVDGLIERSRLDKRELGERLITRSVKRIGTLDEFLRIRYPSSDLFIECNHNDLDFLRSVVLPGDTTQDEIRESLSNSCFEWIESVRSKNSSR